MIGKKDSTRQKGSAKGKKHISVASNAAMIMYICGEPVGLRKWIDTKWHQNM